MKLPGWFFYFPINHLIRPGGPKWVERFLRWYRFNRFHLYALPKLTDRAWILSMSFRSMSINVNAAAVSIQKVIDQLEGEKCGD